ncbi:MAG: TetR/AcrR family transcriptional regulator [Terracidiphilus sp.]
MMAMLLAGTKKRTKEIGLRERSKVENQDKIVMAARKLFAELGYEATTLRQIAADAGLGVGTLFNYIGDKRDLIYLIFNSEMESLTDKALAATRPWQSFSAKILTITEPHYRLFGSDPLLSRILLSEILTHTPGIHLEQYLDIRSRLIRGLEDLVADALQTGEIQSTEDAKIIARSIFFAISGALRWWLASPDPEWRAGMREFEKTLNIQVEGLRVSQSGAVEHKDSASSNDRAYSGKVKK